MKLNFDPHTVPTPCYVVDEGLLENNLRILSSVAEKAGCRILLAQKAFSMFSMYPLIARYLHGTTASGIYEARLGHEEMGGETHVFSPAYNERDFDQLAELCDHIIFNSFAQLERFGARAIRRGKKVGIRVNPECSTQEHAIYDPCAPGSRLGVTAANFRGDQLEEVSGLHFHTLCEQDSDALEITLAAFEEKFGSYLSGMEWVNFGGGHHITRPGYDIDRLVRCIRDFRERHAGMTVYLEPGEAVALNAGFLVTTVLDVADNGVKNAILDTSAACHMPDVIEMPYRPNIVGAGLPGEKPYQYRLGGPTCLAGDVVGDYSFNQPLNPGDRLVLMDMAIYSMVKNNTFNGMPLPSIAVCDKAGNVKVIREFGYNDFKERLS